MTNGTNTVKGEYREQWTAAAERLSKNGEKLAGVFLGFKPDAFAQHGESRILYVGKATAGTFAEADVHASAYDGRYAFWDFARRIALAFQCRTEQCIAWTNISKLSRREVAADASLLEGLEKLAIDTLESEIALTDAEVIVFVTLHFNDAVVHAISEGSEPHGWEKSEEETGGQINDVWWKRRSDGRAILWMEHPQYVASDKLDYVAKKIVMLRDNQPGAYRALS